MTKKINRELSSFRDPSGYVYYDNQKVYRRVNKVYFKEYDYFIKSGLYDELKNNGYIVGLKEVNRTSNYIDLEVDTIPFISYPYEWSFDEYKDAAILTLSIEEIALKYDMTLKDATSYNVQFLDGKPIFIDILSFIFYKDGDPWGAYGQFVRHFICPIVLMSSVDIHLNSLMRNYIDGIPLDVCSNILGHRGGFFAYQHIKLHNKTIIKNDNNTDVRKVYIKKISLLNMIFMMKNGISNLKIKDTITEWDNYYNNTNYDSEAFKSKSSIVDKFLKYINLNKNDIIWDLGANDGKYSIIASKYSNVIAFDIDVNAVNRNYLNNKNGNNNILPLVLDLFNPSPSIGFDLKERKSINERGGARCIMALALIHHLSISNNTSFSMIALSFSKLSKYLIIEFVPKNDSKVKRLLSTREDIFSNYNEEEFEKSFEKYYKIVKKEKVKDSFRVIYLMESIYE